MATQQEDKPAFEIGEVRSSLLFPVPLGLVLMTGGKDDDAVIALVNQDVSSARNKYKNVRKRICNSCKKQINTAIGRLVCIVWLHIDLCIVCLGDYEKGGLRIILN